MANISVVIATFGDRKWADLAATRAFPSVQAQTHPPVSIHVVHGDTLHEARNDGAAEAPGDWLCFVDADDELDAGYLQAMDDMITTCHLENDVLLQPATLGIVNGKEDPEPVLIPRKPLTDGNFMVIGTLMRTEQFRRVGGFREWPCYEDWDLFLRCWIDGADLLAVPDAVYRVHVSADSRNNCPRSIQMATYTAIRTEHVVAARRRQVAAPRRR